MKRSVLCISCFNFFCVYLCLFLFIGCSNSKTFVLNSTPLPPCDLNTVNENPCLASEVGNIVTGSLGSDILQWQNASSSTTITADIPNAYYQSKGVLFTEPNLIAANIKAGVSIFGVLGISGDFKDPCATPGLQNADCAVTSNSFWTTSAGTSVFISGTTQAVIPAGYYTGAPTCTVNDSQLVPENIIAGISILGVTGSFSSPYSPCTDNLNNSTQCFTAANRYVCTTSQILPGDIKNGLSLCGVTGSYGGPTNPNISCVDDQLNAQACNVSGNISARFVTSISGNSFNVANGSLSAFIPLGYYDGTETATMSDTQLISANIKSGVTIFGVTGSMIYQLLPCQDDTLNSAQCFTGTTSDKNRFVTPSLGSSITAWNNVNSLTVVSGSMPLGYYPAGSTITFNEPSLVSRYIKSGVSLFNVPGSFSPTVLNSNAHHDQTNTTITQSAETTNYIATPLPTPYRDVPVLAKDNDGYVTPGVSSSQVTFATRDVATGTEWNAGVPRKVCGKGISTNLYDKISDCSTQHALKPSWNAGVAGKISWDGAAKANAGQGSWTLVTIYSSTLANGSTCDTSCKEVWRDDRTNLLWSDKLTTSDNWCRASGNAEANDTAGICNNISSQPSYPATTQSWCAEDGPTTMTEVTGSGENWSAQSYHSAKGGLGKETTIAVFWRLPTKYDFGNAEVNGIRFVLPGMADTGGGSEWTASVKAANNSLAWKFLGTLGFTTSVRSSTASVRCVGR